MRASRAVISFTFDDFPRSALLTGGEILTEHGAVGSYYASLGLMGCDGPTGQIFHDADLQLLCTQGHELGCHTFDHKHAYETAPAAFEESIIRNRQALKSLVPGAEFKSLSYPIGNPRPETKRRSARHFGACRGGGQKYNRGEIDLNLLSGFFLEQSRDDLNAVCRMIDAACENYGWLIFATHDVCETPTRYGCTPSFFEGVVRYSVNSGAKIAPVGKALELIHDGS
jgi:peptidoglycan/xylan/chitin deacetylase (PgdA/CDA1 family)